MWPEITFFLITATLLLLLGHVSRAIRWTLLFSPNKIEKRIDLLVALSLGYIINMFVPYRLGELFRVWYVSFKTNISWPNVLATVVAERFSDMIVLIIILIGLLLFVENPQFAITLQTFIVMGTALVVTFIAIQKSKHFRRIIWSLTSIFNNRLQMAFLNAAWQTSELVLNTGLLKFKYIVATLIMWSFYFASFYLFSLSIQVGFDETFSALLLEPMSSNLAAFSANPTSNAIALLIFTVTPIIIILAYTLAKRHQTVSNFIANRKRQGWYNSGYNNNVSQNKFAADREYEFFLSSLFSGDNYATTAFGLNAVEDSTVVRLFNGGSDAITALVSIDNKLVIRKFATHSASQKLAQQYEWIKSHQDVSFPLVSLLNRSQTDDPFYYDMPLIEPASDYYDFIHTNDIDKSLVIFDQMYDAIQQHHKLHLKPITSDLLIDHYLEEKVIKNTQTILDFASTVFEESHFTINNIEFDLKEFETLLNKTWLKQQITHTQTSSIHGDLTIENIIVAPFTEDGWYLIDPNSENIFNTPLIDWAKLFQSLHLGYEGMNRNAVCSLQGNALSLPLSKSEEYSLLYKHLNMRLAQDHSQSFIKEVRFHELINYLRLTPYKIRQDKHRGLCFFAATCLLLKNYLEN